MPKVCLKKYLTICLEPPQSTAFLHVHDLRGNFTLCLLHVDTLHVTGMLYQKLLAHPLTWPYIGTLQLRETCVHQLLAKGMSVHRHTSDPSHCT